MIAAKRFGTMRYRKGLSPINSRASICSLIRMIPISAVTAEPALPVTIRAERTGPSSLMRARATIGPRRAADPNRFRV